LRNNPILMFIMVIIVFIIPMNSIADEVCLKNGDRLTGQVIRMEAGQLILKTSYAGKISMVWQEVVSLKTDDSVKVVLKDETALEGNTLSIEDGKMMLETAKIEAPVFFSLADVKSINPEPIKTVNITTRANVNITSERGNTDSDNYYFDGEFVACTKKNRYKIGGELSKEESDGTTT
jgi:hypothetical protein